MLEYIKRLEIESFRGLNKLDLDNLVQINILTGDNTKDLSQCVRLIPLYDFTFVYTYLAIS